MLGVIASVQVATHELFAKSIYREQGVVSAYSVSSLHGAVTVIGKYNTFAICAVHNNHNRSLLINLVSLSGERYIKILFALTSENLRAKLAHIFKYITDPGLFASQSVHKRASLCLITVFSLSFPNA